MSNFSDSSHRDSTSVEESIQSTLQSGLFALKQKNYQAAIDHLETTHQTATRVSTLLKAQMGLVTAYAATGETDRAIALCRSLCDQSSPQVKAWATQTLAELEGRSPVPPPPSHPDQTGFAPVAPAAADETGFVPLSTNSAYTRERVAPKNRQQKSDRTLPDPQATEILLPESELQSPAKISISTGKSSLTKQSRAAAIDSLSPTPSAAKLPNGTALTWRQAGRMQKWTRSGKPNVFPLWALQLLTILILGWVLCTLMQVGQTLLNYLIFFLSWIPWLRSIWFALNPIWSVGIGLIALFTTSPWLLHLLLQRLYHLQPLSLNELERHSPEAVRLLKRASQQHGRLETRLGILPLSAPLCFSYGCLPHLARIAVSQGLLQQLSDDEIAVIYAAELAHIDSWDVGVMSGLVLVAQLPYAAYWSVADWGNRQADRVLQSVAVLVSSTSYGVYWCCRLAGLWLSQVRLYYSDRSATDLTGNPNGLTRALLKLTIGMAADIQRQGYTHPLLESFDLLMPVGHRAALTLGSLYPHTPTPTLLSWDRSHRCRRWFACQSGHPLLGDRLSVLNAYAQRWRLETEMDWSQESGVRSQESIQNPKSRIQNSDLRRLLLQTAPIVGILVGLAIGLVFWLLGWVTYKAYSYSFDWLWYERQAIARGCLLLGFGIGLLIQINPAFRDIPRSNRQTESDLVDLLNDAISMPIDSTPVRFQGKLLGRRKFYNRCHQDLILHTATGLIRLHYSSRGGFLGNVFSQSPRPIDLIKSNETVSVTGWFRRGAIPWIDVETIQSKRITFRSGYPVWLTVVAIASALWGVYTIF